MAYGAALEKRCAAMHRGFKSHPLRGEVLEWPIRRAWRARVAQATVGSNPTLSATSFLWLRFIQLRICKPAVTYILGL
mgnify:CR=1 FL=1